MGVVTGDLIQCVDNQSYLGQQVLNVYYYRWFSTPVADRSYLEGIADDWETKVLDPVLDLQNDGLSHVSREWRNISNNVDLFVNGEVKYGSNSSTETTRLPSYVSIGFLLQRDSLVSRNGYKRLAGLTDADVSGNKYVGGAPSVAAVEVAFAALLSFSLFDVAAPIIVKRPIVPPVESYSYSSIISARFRTVGTQNTRKAGGGD